MMVFCLVINLIMLVEIVVCKIDVKFQRGGKFERQERFRTESFRSVSGGLISRRPFIINQRLLSRAEALNSIPHWRRLFNSIVSMWSFLKPV